MFKPRLIARLDIKGENLIYVCVNNTCKFPVDNVDAALKLISKKDEKI